jgi:hypothetical protein
MLNDNGWIKLHRRLLNNPIIEKPEYLTLWITLLLLANHEPTSFIWNKKKQTVEPGQLLTGRKKLSKLTGISEGTTENILNYLESEQQIEQQKTTKFRLVKIKKWKEYQISDNNLNNRMTTELQQNDTYKKVKKVKNNKNNTLSADEPPTEDIPFPFKDKLKTMFSDKDRRMPIIAYYWTIKEISFENKKQYEAGLKRELKPSGDLIGFTNERIKEVCQWLKENADFKWTMETILKYINEDLNKLTRQKIKEPEIEVPEYAKRRQYEK